MEEPSFWGFQGLLKGSEGPESTPEREGRAGEGGVCGSCLPKAGGEVGWSPGQLPEPGELGMSERGEETEQSSGVRGR